MERRTPQAQATDALAADEALVKRLESLSPAERDTIRLQLFGMDLDADGLTRIRLGEHAVHSWDVAVALDPAATVAADAVALLLDSLGPLIARAAQPAGSPRLRVTTSSPERAFLLETGDPVRLEPADGANDASAATAACRGADQARLRQARPRAHAASRGRGRGPGRPAPDVPWLLNRWSSRKDHRASVRQGTRSAGSHRDRRLHPALRAWQVARRRGAGHALHRMAASAFPVLKTIPPERSCDARGRGDSGRLGPARPGRAQPSPARR